MNKKEQILKDCERYVGTQTLQFSVVYDHISKIHDVEESELKKMFEEKGWLIGSNGLVPLVLIKKECLKMEPDTKNGEPDLEALMSRKAQKVPQNQNKNMK